MASGLIGWFTVWRIAQHQQTLDDFACRHLKRLGELCDRRVDGYADRRRLDP